MGKKRTIWKKKLFDDASIRSMIFIYFTITALAASVLISLSLYQRMSRQVGLALLWHDQECRSVEPVDWK